MTNDFENENENGNEINNGEGFAEPEITVSDSPDKKDTLSGNIAHAWHNRPLFKFFVLVIGVFLVGVALVSFFGGPANNEIAHLIKPPNISEPPGGEASPYMIEQTKKATATRSRDALQSGGSAMPTPIGQKSDVGLPGMGDNKDDPLRDLRLEMEAQRRQLAQQQMQIQQRPPEPFDDSLAQAMQRQMNQLLQSWIPQGMKSVTVISADELKAEQERQAQALANALKAKQAASDQTKAKKVVAAGTVSYAQLLTEANSDVPGPILGQIVSGPLNGARVVGSFQVAEGYEKYLVLRFHLAAKKGKDYTIDAIALDPNTTLGGMATEVDERYFTRLVLPTAAAFLEGFGSAMGHNDVSYVMNGNTTIVTNSREGIREGLYSGIGTGAQTMGRFFQHQADITKPLVRVAAGTPMGLFFLSPVMDPDTVSSTMPTTAQRQFLPAPGSNTVYNATNPYNAPYGTSSYGAYTGGNVPLYPGTTVNGYGSPNYGNITPGAYINNPYNQAISPYPYGASYGTMGYSPYAQQIMGR